MCTIDELLGVVTEAQERRRLRAMRANIETQASLTQRLDAEIQARRHREAVCTIDELLGVVPEAQERRRLRALRANIEHKSERRPREWLIGVAAVVGLVWLVTAVNYGGSGPGPQPPDTLPSPKPSRPGAPPSSPETSQPRVPSVPAPAAPLESEPAPWGKTSLTLAELRWCAFQARRLDAASVYLDTERAIARPAAFSQAVSHLNELARKYKAACQNRHRFDRDATTTDREATNRQADLDATGRGWMEAILWPRGAPPAPRPPDLDDPEFARVVQERLNALGFIVGVADGSFGPRSRAALSRFKRSRGLADDASIDEATLRALSLPVAARKDR